MKSRPEKARNHAILKELFESEERSIKCDVAVMAYLNQSELPH